ncbi:hypothetical protein ACFPK9_10725 [Rubritalea spongiae]|uniref:Uncharacterized protein n=1 Tax=Rubritalea spongiae TaxID=430797 RepID=A0ABW5DXT6_9BACT
MKSLLIILSLAITLMLPSCDSERKPKKPEQTVVIEAADYKPVGEGVKFLGLALLGSTIAICITALMYQEGDKND